MAVSVRIICDFCRWGSAAYDSVARAKTDLYDNYGWTLVVLARRNWHRCTQCTKAGRVELAKGKP